MIAIRVLFLGPARDFAGTDEARLELADGATVGDARDVLKAKYPNLAPALPSIRIAVNEAFAIDSSTLEGGDEVALIPPVSGGTSDSGIHIELTSEKLCGDFVRAFVEGDESRGGIVLFEGVTRRETDPEHGSLLRLDYEAYESMALSQLEGLAEAAKSRWSLGKVAIVHRVGAVPPGDASVLIAVAAGHRAEAFESCRWLIDQLKRETPIWKKDVFEDGYVRWVKAAAHQAMNSDEGRNLNTDHPPAGDARRDGDTGKAFLEGAIATFRSQKELAERAIRQLSDEQLHQQLDAATNSVAVVIKHMSGNMQSRWTDFLVSDGEKPWRARDGEFVDDIPSREELMSAWEQGWSCLFSALATLRSDGLGRTIRIRGEPLTVNRGICRQLSHYGYHVGQIVLIARLLAGDRWTTLTIPRGGSVEYNRRVWMGTPPA